MPKPHEPSWGRKPDGRPFINLIVNGKRRRKSLLTQEHIRRRDLAPPDEECERLFRMYLARILPALECSTPDGRRMADIFRWYTERIMPANGCRPRNIERTAKILEAAALFLRKNGVDTIDSLVEQPAAIDAYVADLRIRYKPSTIKNMVNRVKAALNAAYRRKLIEVQPITQWPRVRVPRKAYSDFDPKPGIMAMIEKTRTSSYYNIVRFIAFQGCRPSLACELLRKNVIGIDSPRPYVSIVDPKTNELDLLPLSPPAAAAVRDELARGVCSPHLFTTRDVRPMDPHDVSNTIAYRGKKWKVTAITCRQNIVSTLYDMGCDDATVKRCTGHASPAVREYRHLRRDAGYDEIAAATENWHERAP